MLLNKKENFEVGEYYTFQVTGDQREFIGKVLTVDENNVTFDNTMFLYGEQMLPVLRSSERLEFTISKSIVTFMGKTTAELAKSLNTQMIQQKTGIVTASESDLKLLK